MVEAILVGLSKKESLGAWGIWSPSGTSAKALAGKVGAQFVSDLDQAQDPQWVMVGCKPQQLMALAENLNGRFQNSLYVSLLAAITESDQRAVLKVPRLVRVMPNLNVKIHEGVTLLSSSSASAELKAVEGMMGKLGLAISMDEAALEELTLLTGSGPALIYEFALNLSQGFTTLTQEQREALARQVLTGVGAHVKQEQQPLQQMIDAVTSKGGVTIAVLEKWREKGLSALLEEGVKRGLERTAELKAILRS
jgi:pyrroline-5-carboxylate reductase